MSDFKKMAEKMAEDAEAKAKASALARHDELLKIKAQYEEHIGNMRSQICAMEEDLAKIDGAISRSHAEIVRIEEMEKS